MSRGATRLSNSHGGPKYTGPIDWRGSPSTEKQHGMLRAMCKATDRNLEQITVALFGKRRLERLCRGEASALIDMMMVVKRNLEKFGDHRDADFKNDDIPF
jgi:hypothetical protein